MSMFFAGLWPIIMKFGASFAIMAGLGAFAWFSPVFKKTALWLMLLVGLTTAAYTVGVIDGENRVKTQWLKAVDQEAVDGEEDHNDAVVTVERDTSDVVRKDPCNRNNWRPGQSSC